MLIVPLLRLNRTGELCRLAQQRPSQKVLVGLIPSALPIRLRLQLAANAPLAFHLSLRDENSHRKGTPYRPWDDPASATGAATRSGLAVRSGSGRICHL